MNFFCYYDIDNPPDFNLKNKYTFKTSNLISDPPNEIVIATESNVPKNRRVSFGTFMDITSKKDEEEDDDFGDPDLNPCFYDKKLQIVSFVTLLALIIFAIGVFALSQQPKGTENKLFNPAWHRG